MIAEGGLDEADLAWFWHIVELARGSRDRLRTELTALDKDDVYRFQDIFLELATELQDEPFSLRLAENESEDGLADVSHWIVSQGRSRYEEVLDDPDTMPSHVDVGDPGNLFSVAYEVYHDRFGEPLDLM